MANRIDSQIQSEYKTWLNNANPAVRQQLIQSKPVSRFITEVNRSHRLSKQQRLRLVEQALVLLEQTYVHLPLKRALNAVEPIQRLRLLRFLVNETPQRELSEMDFHRDLQRIFASLRDVHTEYSLPYPFRGNVAYLPFMVEEYHEELREGFAPQRFMVSHVAEGFKHKSFKRGVDVLFWNGVPIRRAIESNGERQAGSNAEARFARGLDALTIRPLRTSLPPDEEWVVITYRTPKGAEHEIKLQWLVVPLSAGNISKPSVSGTSRGQKVAIDRHKAAINQVRKLLYAPKVVEAQKKATAHRKKYRKWKYFAPERFALGTCLPSVFHAKKVWQGNFGYIRIFTFEPDEVGVDEFVEEFVRLVRLLPGNGLIIDVRGNPGGFIEAGERLLQLFTPNDIEPARFEFINTPLTFEISRRAPKEQLMGQFAKSISESVRTSATYSTAFPLTSKFNDIGQVYYGPVLLITDALCYSTTDILTAGFQDNKIGKILGTSGNTGAGGANVYRHEDLRRWLRNYRKSPFKPLPRGARMSVALRRSLRVGPRSGRPLEALGVAPDIPYNMTKRDLLDNHDLVDRAVQILLEKPVRKLSVERTVNKDGSRTITICTKNIHRLEIEVGKRAEQPFSVKRDRESNTSEYTVEVPKGPKIEMELRGYNRGTSLVAASKQKV